MWLAYYVSFKSPEGGKGEKEVKIAAICELLYFLVARKKKKREAKTWPSTERCSVFPSFSGDSVRGKRKRGQPGESGTRNGSHVGFSYGEEEGEGEKGEEGEKWWGGAPLLPSFVATVLT